MLAYGPLLGVISSRQRLCMRVSSVSKIALPLLWGVLGCGAENGGANGARGATGNGGAPDTGGIAGSGGLSGSGGAITETRQENGAVP
jgi:uncharacterized membrane protein YgcG